jgi:hypothetical protein
MKTFRHQSRTALVLFAACLLTLAAGTASAQSDVQKTLQQYAADEVKGYIQPFGDLFGANLNAGLFRGADIAGTGFHMKVEIVGIASMVGDAQKVYMANAPAGFNPATFQTATIFGGTGAQVTDATTALVYRGSDGIFNTTFFPDATLQLTLGNIYGTRASLRFITTPAMSGLPKATQWGIGAQHSVSQYFPVIPLEVAAHVFYNKFTFGDLIDLSGYSIGVDASKSFSILMVYGGLSVESSTMNLTYTPSNATIPAVSIDLDGANKFRATVGLSLNLAFFSVFADANFGSVTNYAAGIGFGN